jgi:hypothetical protein
MAGNNEIRAYSIQSGAFWVAAILVQFPEHRGAPLAVQQDIASPISARRRAGTSLLAPQTDSAALSEARWDAAIVYNCL